MNHLDGLNEQQKKAVLHTEGPLLVIAGAGTGKTKTITSRIIHLIQSGIDPFAILAVTFTNKAAGEMRERVQSSHDSDDSQPMIRTFHSLGVYLLRRHHDLMKLPKSFVILDTDDQKKLIKRAMESLDIDPKRWEPKRILNIISKNKGDAIDVDTFAKSIASELQEITGTVWKKYEELKTREGGLDFDDLLIKTYELLRDHKDIREHYQNLWKYIHIDEYQDTNKIQYHIAKALSDSHNNICVVGDGDQNIYSWRGADIRNILNFERDFGGATIIPLEKNYRSTKTILSAADEIIRKNKARVDKELVGTRHQGNPITLYKGFSEVDEAYFIARKAKGLIDAGSTPNEIAVLFRTNFQSRVLEEAFLSEGVPYQVVGVRFFERKEIKDVLAYVRAAVNRQSLSDIARVVNNPKRGIGKTSVAKILSGNIDGLTAKARESYTKFEELLDQIEQNILFNSPSAVVKFVIEKSGLKQMYETKNEDDLERLANMEELVTYATKYDSLPIEEALQIMMEEISLMSDQDSIDKKRSNIPTVKLSTIHAAKGLEFNYVFIAGLEQGLFPSDVGDDKRDAEEERRLMYVAITRAKEHLYLSWASIRRIYGEQRVQIPSEFIDDIPEDLLEEEENYGEPPVKTVYLDW